MGGFVRNNKASLHRQDGMRRKVTLERCPSAAEAYRLMWPLLGPGTTQERSSGAQLDAKDFDIKMIPDN